MEIRRYRREDKELWNSFVSKARNATFLFDRNYMDYHADRFDDNSFMFYHKGKLKAVLPANVAGDTLYSHQGLTYGGLLLDKKATVEDVLECFDSLNSWLRENGISKVVYKALPWIYQQYPSEEDLYALTWKCKAQLISRNIASTIVIDNKLKFAESRKSGIRKALSLNIEVGESNDVDGFWHVLEDNLGNRYNAKPVHTASEMKLLMSRFPNNIKLYVAKMNGEIVGGTLIYVTPQVVHTQYISASVEGKKHGALDLLFDYIINKVYANCRYFDFGKSTEQGGAYLNEPLIFQKEGFGGRGVCYDWYQWEL
ncbi:MAG: GNAT family N-acetyltransferase [Prevotella sp.]|nr:GNAT family N-acetyltransferase [Prevotella sp.]MDY4150951.1 GNAT family N-acetyltransferase [Prevotella sp.]